MFVRGNFEGTKEQQTQKHEPSETKTRDSQGLRVGLDGGRVGYITPVLSCGQIFSDLVSYTRITVGIGVGHQERVKGWGCIYNA